MANADALNAQAFEKLIEARLNGLPEYCSDSCSIERAQSLPVTRAAQYLSMVAHWGLAMNLVPDIHHEALVDSQLIDCLLAEALFHSNFSEVSQSPLIDVGSGAGFPGIVFALQQPERRLLLVESRHKRAVFLKEVRRQLRIANLEVCTERFEISQAAKDFQPEVIISRATGLGEAILDTVDSFTKPPALVVYCAPRGTPIIEHKRFVLSDRINYKLPPGSRERLVDVYRSKIGNSPD